jgi:hypothetical protein
VKLGAASVAASTLQTGSILPYEEVSKTLTFTPLASSGTALAGPMSSEVTFTTSNPDNALNATDVMTFYRIVPASWEFVKAEEGSKLLAAGSEIAAKSTTVTITANANLPWKGQATDNTTGATGAWAESTPVAYTLDDQIVVPVPARPWDDPDSWNLEGSTTVRVGYNGLTGVPGLFPAEEISFKRPAYTLAVPTILTVSPYTVKIEVTTTAPEYALEIRLVSNGDIIGEETGSESEPTITLERNTTGAARPARIYNKITGELLKTFSQPYALDIVLGSHVMPTWYSNKDTPWTWTPNCTGGYTFVPAGYNYAGCTCNWSGVAVGLTSIQWTTLGSYTGYGFRATCTGNIITEWVGVSTKISAAPYVFCRHDELPQ